MLHRALILVLAIVQNPSAAQNVLHGEDYEDPDLQGWRVNGQPMVFAGEGNPGSAGGVPLLDFFGISLSNEQSGNPTLGDLTRHGAPLRFSVDIRTLGLFNFFGLPMDPRLFPVTIEFVDERPGPFPVVSVYFTGIGMPPVANGWERFVFEIPDPTRASLPPGWGGTGDEDPVTFMPRLPPGVTYDSVMRSVDRVQVTTFQPGYFYAASFWEVRFDNIRLERVGGCDGVDFNNDGLFPDTLDVDDFVSVFAGGPCSTGNCNDIDFNNDGLFPDTLDVESLLSVFAGGACL